MRILIIGHSVKDIIHMNDEESISPGGIYYSVLGSLSSNDPGKDTIYLLTALDYNNKDIFSVAYNSVKDEYITFAERIPVVHLKIFDTAERCEYYENIAQKLSLNKIQDIDSFDGILINMITGFDIEVKDLLKLRSQYKGPIYLDIHTLSRGIDENNQRIFRVIPDAEKWISALNFLQVNEYELLTLFEEKDQLIIVKKALSTGLKFLILTMGYKGARIFWLNKGEVSSLFYPAIKIETKNKVGCGDIFGSVFFNTYIKSCDIRSSLKKANIAAGCAAGYSNIKEYVNLRNDTLSRSD